MTSYALADGKNSMWLFPKRKKQQEPDPKVQEEIEALKKEFKDVANKSSKSTRKATETLKNENKDIAFYIYYATNGKDRR